MGMNGSSKTPEGTMFVDVGGGSTKVSVLSPRGIVASQFSTRSGIKMDQAIMNLVKEKYHVRIGRKEAESLKIALGAQWDLEQTPRISETFGLSLVSGLPVKIAVTGEDIASVVNPILYDIFKCIRDVIQRTPPAILADIREHGIKLIGGGSQLKGLDILISRITGFRAYVVERPNYINAVGAGKSLDYINEFRDSLQDLH